MSSVPSTPFEKDVVDVLTTMMEIFETQHARFAHLEGHVAELSKRSSQVVVKVKNRRVLPFVAGAAVGVYVYHKLQEGNGWTFEVGRARKNEASKDDATYTVTPDDTEADPDTTDNTRI